MLRRWWLGLGDGREEAKGELSLFCLISVYFFSILLDDEEAC